MPVRRTITVADDINSVINKFRAAALEMNIDLDYTQVANALMMFGIRYLIEKRVKGEQLDQLDMEIMDRFFFGEELKLESLLDRSFDALLTMIGDITKSIASELARRFRGDVK